MDPEMLSSAFRATSFDYKNREKTFQVEVGGGLDKEFNKGTRIAAGIYYNYLKNKSDFLFTIDNSLISDHTNYPDQREHKVILRLAGEKEISPMFAMRMGLNFFYGWVKEDLKFNSNILAPSDTEKISLNGISLGVGASSELQLKFSDSVLSLSLAADIRNWTWTEMESGPGSVSSLRWTS